MVLFCRFPVLVPIFEHIFLYFSIIVFIIFNDVFGNTLGLLIHVTNYFENKESVSLLKSSFNDKNVKFMSKSL